MEVKPGYKQTEVGVIPEAWEYTNVQGIASSARNAIVGGPFGSDLVSADYVDDGVPVIRGQNMSGQWVSGAFVYVTDKKAKALEANLARPGDIVFTQRGTLGQVSLVPEKPFPKYLVSQSQMKVSLNRDIADPLFYYYVFTGEEHQRIVRDGTIQTGVPHINLGILKAIPVQRPEMIEQRAIAEALSDVDGLLGGLDRLIAKKRYLKQAAMQQLLTGQTRLPGYHSEWEVKRLGDVVDTDPENLGSDTRRDFSFNYIALEDVDRGFLRSHSEQLFASAASRARRKLRPDDVLVSTVRPNLHSHLHFKVEAGSWVCSTGFCVVRCREGVTHPGYVFFHLLGGCVNRQIDALLTGSNYPAINSGDVRALQIPFPSYPEQTAIAEVLTEMDAELAALEQRREKTRALKQAMMQELLTGKTRLI
jgi:type I restriction enzyme, S subunit